MRQNRHSLLVFPKKEVSIISPFLGTTDNQFGLKAGHTVVLINVHFC